MSQGTKTALVESINKAMGNTDPAIERHAGELFGTTSDPDFTPVNQRNPGPGRVLVEWIGENGPLAERKLALAVERGWIPKPIVDAWKTLHGRITTRIPGMCHHTMTRERDGMSETYKWGPEVGTYVQAVTYKDAEVLLSGTFAHQFRVIGYQGEQPADANPIDRFLAPYVDAETTDKVRHLVIVDHADERLVGVGNAGGKRLGSWTA